MADGLVFNPPVNKMVSHSGQSAGKTFREHSVQKIVLIMCQSVSAKIITDYYIQDILEEEFSFEYWNISEILFNKKYETTEPAGFGIEYFTFKTLPDLKERILTINKSNTLFIPQITYDYRSFKIFRILTRLKCQTAFFARGALPVRPTKKSTTSVLKMLDYKLPLKIFSKIQQKLKCFFLQQSKKLRFIKPYDVLFVAGEKGCQAIGIGSEIDLKKSKIVPVNYFDYDIFQSYSINKNIDQQLKYCVFLDEYFTRHPDFVALGIPLINEHSYFEEINNFFDTIEQSFDIKVIVAAHPKSNYTDNPFKGRTLIKNQTNKLVASSEFVICHMSTSLSFAILNKKPLLFISCNEIKKKLPAYNSYILFLAEYLHSGFHNISEKICLGEKAFNSYNGEVYEQYALDFLTSEATNNKRTKDIFINYLKTCELVHD